jgi:sulfite exporter TauE/SafE/plastocyanin domain-containing protein/copper chaperone CopZ
MEKRIIPIKGMHCRSCEILIEEKLLELAFINNVRIDLKKSQAAIYSRKSLSTAEMVMIKDRVRAAGYDVGLDDSKSWISLDIHVYWDLLRSAIILSIIFLVASRLGFFDMSTGVANNPSSLAFVLLIGLTAGISTCMALIGGLVLGIAARHAEKHSEASAIEKFRPHLYFNLGRIVSFFLLGGLIGLIGKAFQLSGPILGVLTIMVGIVMLFLGLQLTELFPRLSKVSFTLPSTVGKFFGIKKRQQREYSHANSMLIGALTFFLPCGFTQAMQLYAMSTGNFLAGALIMSVFAIGTAPGLLGIGGITSILEGALAKKFFKFTGLLVVLLAVFNLSNGWNLIGLSSISAKKPISTADDPNVTVKDGIQIVRMTQTGAGYKPNKFTIRQNMPVRWIIKSENANACSASILMPKAGIRQFLKPGENIIEFTPKEMGELKFTCSMGMYPGKFIVVQNEPKQESIETSPEEDKQAVDYKPKTEPTTESTPTKPRADASALPTKTPANEVQVIKTKFFASSYDSPTDIEPNTFTVKAGQPVRFEIDAEVDGEGCMSTIMIPGLIDNPEYLEAGKTIKWEFTPETGTYDITCAMGVPRGKIKVI